MQRKKLETVSLIWQAAWQKGDFHLLLPLISEKLNYYPPHEMLPEKGRDQSLPLLKFAFELLADYRVEQSYIGTHSIVFEFYASMDEIEVEGIDRIILAKDGSIKEIKSFLRSQSALEQYALAFESGLTNFAKRNFLMMKHNISQKLRHSVKDFTNRFNSNSSKDN